MDDDIRKGYKRCPQCKSELQERDKFCGRCGYMFLRGEDVTFRIDIDQDGAGAHEFDRDDFIGLAGDETPQPKRAVCPECGGPLSESGSCPTCDSVAASPKETVTIKAESRDKSLSVAGKLLGRVGEELTTTQPGGTEETADDIICPSCKERVSKGVYCNVCGGRMHPAEHIGGRIVRDAKDVVRSGDVRSVDRHSVIRRPAVAPARRPSQLSETPSADEYFSTWERKMVEGAKDDIICARLVDNGVSLICSNCSYIYSRAPKFKPKKCTECGAAFINPLEPILYVYGVTDKPIVKKKGGYIYLHVKNHGDTPAREITAEFEALACKSKKVMGSIDTIGPGQYDILPINVLFDYEGSFSCEVSLEYKDKDLGSTYFLPPNSFMLEVLPGENPLKERELMNDREKMVIINIGTLVEGDFKKGNFTEITDAVINRSKIGSDISFDDNTSIETRAEQASEMAFPQVPVYEPPRHALFHSEWTEFQEAVKREDAENIARLWDPDAYKKIFGPGVVAKYEEVVGWASRISEAMKNLQAELERNPPSEEKIWKAGRTLLKYPGASYYHRRIMDAEKHCKALADIRLADEKEDDAEFLTICETHQYTLYNCPEASGYRTKYDDFKRRAKLCEELREAVIKHFDYQVVECADDPALENDPILLSYDSEIQKCREHLEEWDKIRDLKGMATLDETRKIIDLYSSKLADCPHLGPKAARLKEKAESRLLGLEHLRRAIKYWDAYDPEPAWDGKLFDGWPLSEELRIEYNSAVSKHINMKGFLKAVEEKSDKDIEDLGFKLVEAQWNKINDYQNEINMACRVNGVINNIGSYIQNGEYHDAINEWERSTTFHLRPAFKSLAPTIIRFHEWLKKFATLEQHDLGFDEFIETYRQISSEGAIIPPHIRKRKATVEELKDHLRVFKQACDSNDYEHIRLLWDETKFTSELAPFVQNDLGKIRDAFARWLKSIELEKLEVNVNTQGAFCTWNWPADRNMKWVHLSARLNTTPVRPDDPMAKTIRIDRTTYQNDVGQAGFKNLCSEHVYIAAYPMCTVGGEVVYGDPAYATPPKRIKLRADLKKIDGIRFELILEPDDSNITIPPFAVVVKSGSRPMKIGDGDSIFESGPNEPGPVKREFTVKDFGGKSVLRVFPLIENTVLYFMGHGSRAWTIDQGRIIKDE